MIIQMVISMSGGRYDNQSWPPVGVDFEVPDEEGEALIGDHNAVFIRDSGQPVPAKAVPAPTTVAQPAPTSAGPVQWETGPAPDPVPPASEVLPPSQPAPTAPKRAWEDYAVALGGDPDDVVETPKAELIREYGGRL